jgi:hypothetical protein
MVAPNIDIRVFDLTVYSPRISGAIVGCIGPATKGPVNEISDFTDEGNYVNFHGRPVDGHYAPRAALRYFRRGNQLKYVRIAGPNLSSATLTVYAADRETPILLLTASSPGTWANGLLSVAVTYNGTQNYNITVYYDGQAVETYVGLTNGVVVTRINNGSSRITAQLAPSAGAVFPGESINTITGALDRLPFAGGNDGAFASTDSESSSTSGVAGRRFYGYSSSVNAAGRTFQNILTITPALAAKAIVYGTVGMPVAPGSFTIRVQTGAGPTFVELSDDATGGYTPGAAGIGILNPSASTHKGFIDYRTGAWGVKLAAGSTFAGGTIDGIWIRASAESVGATAAGEESYAGTLSAGPCAVGFFNSAKALITVPVSEVVGVPAAGASAGSATAGLKTLAGWIVPGTVVLTPSHATLDVPAAVYDDGFGGWRTGPNGTGSTLTGAINYLTGVFTITWDPTGFAMPAAGSLAAEYDALVMDMGGGAVPGTGGSWIADEVEQVAAGAGVTVASSDVGAQTIRGPILPGTLRLAISLTSISADYTVYDDGVGGWLTKPRGTPGAASVTGTLNYDTGAWTVTLPGGGTVTINAVVTASYVSVAADQAARALRGAGLQTQGAGGTFVAGLLQEDPAASNGQNGSNYLDHRTGDFAIKLNLTPLGGGTQSFDVKDNGTLTAVYLPAEILGFGDGTTTTFTGVLSKAPYRRQANRLLGFQGSQASTAAAADAQTTYATLGATAAADHWTGNVALASDPANVLDMRDGETSIKWTSAPLREESVYVVAEEIVLHVECLYPGDIGNERATITEGFYVIVGADPSLAGTVMLQVLFAGVVQEQFGQAADVNELVTAVNDPVNGSKLVRVTEQVAGDLLPIDVKANQTCGLAGAFTMADVIGTKQGQTYTGMQLFSNDEVVPLHWLVIPGQWHRQVISAAQTLCEDPHRRALAVIPQPDLDDPLKFRDFVNGHYNALAAGGVARATVTVPYPPLVAIDSSQLTTITPWVNYFDAYGNKNVWEPSDGDIIERVAATPAPWQPIAGLRRGKINADKIRYSPSRGDRNLIYGLVGSTTEIINTIIKKEGRGLVLGGQRTAQRRASALDRINVRWTVNVIMNLLDAISQDFLFELNDSILWRDVTQACNRVLQPIVEQRGLTEAFVVCDGTTTSPEMQDGLELNAKLFIKVTPATEYITYDLILTPQGANFADIQVVG